MSLFYHSGYGMLKVHRIIHCVYIYNIEQKKTADIKNLKLFYVG